MLQELVEKQETDNKQTFLRQVPYKTSLATTSKHENIFNKAS